MARPGGALLVAGLRTWTRTRAAPSPAAALRDVPLGEPVILLTHWPDPFATAPPRVAADDRGALRTAAR
jgi:hypothetical protein